MENDQAWVIRESVFTPDKLHHKETIFTIGNGYLSIRGAFEEGYPGDGRATFVHGVFDYAPIVMTELANAPDWLLFNIYLNGERFSLANGTLKDFQQSLDLRSGSIDPPGGLAVAVGAGSHYPLPALCLAGEPAPAAHPLRSHSPV